MTSDPLLVSGLQEVARTLPGVRLTPGKRKFRHVSELARALEDLTQPTTMSMPLIDKPLPSFSNSTWQSCPSWDLDTPIPSPISEVPNSPSAGDEESYYRTATEGTASILGCGDSADEEGETDSAEDATDAHTQHIYAVEHGRNGASPSSSQILDWLTQSNVNGHFHQREIGGFFYDGVPSNEDEPTGFTPLPSSQVQSLWESKFTPHLLQTPQMDHSPATLSRPTSRDILCRGNAFTTTTLRRVLDKEINPIIEQMPSPLGDLPALSTLTRSSDSSDASGGYVTPPQRPCDTSTHTDKDTGDSLLFQYVGAYTDSSEAEEHGDSDTSDDEICDGDSQDSHGSAQSSDTQQTVSVKIHIDENVTSGVRGRHSMSLSATADSTSRSGRDKRKAEKLSIDTSHLHAAYEPQDELDPGDDSGIEFSPEMRLRRPTSLSSPTSSTFSLNLTIHADGSGARAQVESSGTTSGRPFVASELRTPLSGRELQKKIRRRSELLRQIGPLQDELASLERVLQAQPDLPRNLRCEGRADFF